MSFIHLHVYSAYSLLSSTVSIHGLIKQAKEQNASVLAITDRNVMYGVIPFYKECIKHHIKPIIGLTADIISPLEQPEKAFPLILLAKNNRGYQNLVKISSVIQTKSEIGIPIKWLRHYADGLIAITPGIEGEIEQLLLDGNIEHAKLVVNHFQEIFKEQSFYLGLERLGHPKEELLLERKIAISNDMNLNMVATNEVRFLKKEHSFAYECLQAMKNGSTISMADINEHCLNGQTYFKPSSEMVELFSDFPEALEHTKKIANQCNVEISFDQKWLPKFPLEEGIKVDQFLHQLCQEGLSKRVKEISETYKERLKYELSIITKMGFSDYFLIVWDFMKYARNQHILTGPGRGSAAGSLVAYCLFITDVDPIQNHLLFERFLNPERISMPDIDIDFPDHQREKVIQYVAKKYGEMHVAQIITFGTFASKAALRDVGRIFGLNGKELDRLSKLIPTKNSDSLKDAYEHSNELQEFVLQSDYNQKLFQTALLIEGLPRHTSTHAAGVVISEKPLVEFIPIQQGHESIYLTQYSMEILEELGLLKMDFLGLRNLSLIERILESIKREKSKKIDIHSFPLDDSKTYELLGKGETNGIFQLESDGMRKVLQQLKPTQFEDIVAVNALYRPGPMDQIPTFIKRKHGHEMIQFPHPDLKKILQPTYGVIVYQEQIMEIASQMAGFTLGEADLLRRAVGKKKIEILNKEREHFVQGSSKNGYGIQTANMIYDLIVQFANYGFNRSHAVAYSLISYQLAYLKAHFPRYFMAALMTTAIGNEEKIAEYIRESKRQGYEILPPSINKSTYSFQVEGKGIRYSLAGIKGIGIQTLKVLFEERRKKPFADLFDFCMRLPNKLINRKIVESLVYSGSFDEFGYDRATLLASLDVALDHADLVNPDTLDQNDLFCGEEFLLKPKYVEVDPIPIDYKLSYEKKVLGLYLSSHPISPYLKRAKSSGAVPISELATYHKKVKIACYIHDTRIIRTKKGESMAFGLVSDESSELECVVFPDAYKQLSMLMKKGNLVLLEGKKEVRKNKLQFIVQAGIPLNFIETMKKLYLKIEKSKQTGSTLKLLKHVIKEFPGTTPVYLFYEEKGLTVQLDECDWVTVNEDFLNEISSLLGRNNVVIKG